MIIIQDEGNRKGILKIINLKKERKILKKP